MKLTNAQIWLIHSLEVLALGGALTTVATIYGAFQAGNFNLSSAGVAVGSAVVAFLSKGYSGIISNANTAQAVGDTVSELRQSHNALIQQVSNLAGLMTDLFHLHAVQQATLANIAQPVQQNQPIAQAVANPWAGASTSTLTPQVAQVPFSVQRNWTNVGIPVPPTQQGQSQ